MKKIAIVVCIVTSMCTMHASEHDSVTQAKKDRPIPHCRLGSAVPPCINCAEFYKNSRNNKEEVLTPQKLSESQAKRRCP